MIGNGLSSAAGGAASFKNLARKNSILSSLVRLANKIFSFASKHALAF
jgi:hypothetical protein